VKIYATTVQRLPRVTRNGDEVDFEELFEPDGDHDWAKESTIIHPGGDKIICLWVAEIGGDR
jgi:hypothetical protein